jgi:hypothetical protein
MAKLNYSELKYVDTRQIFIPGGELEFYPNGLVLPGKVDKIKVTEKEKVSLMKRKNGNKNCFEEIKSVKDKTEIEA